MVGDSRTGEIDKIDGPYYFFKTLQRLRRVLPAWMPTVGIEGGEINIVPVDYVAAAIDHIAHQPDLDGRAFHLTDPDPRTAGEVINLFAKAADAPQLRDSEFLQGDESPMPFLASAIKASNSSCAEGRVLGGGLDLDDVAVAGQDEVGVGLGVRNPRRSRGRAPACR